MAETVTEMYVAPLPWSVTMETYANVYPSFQVNIHPIWKDMLKNTWILNNPPSGISIAANTGVVSGLADNSIFMADVTVSTEKCPGQEWTKTLEVIRRFDYTGSEQSITLKPGDYKMECWGASGSNLTTNVFGKGAYVKGDVHLNASKTFYVFVGGVNGYNGGGDESYLETSGGGATDIRLLGGVWSDFESLKSRILIAAGGGLASGTTQRGASGGAGGGLTGYDGTCPYTSYLTYGRGATQTSGGVHGVIERTPQWYGSTSGSFAVGGRGTTRYHGGGGGGFYGGGGAGISSKNYTGGGGGSSFISGHNGCNAISGSSTSGNIVHTGQSIHYSGLYFTNTVMIDGAGYQWTTARGGYVGMPNLTDTGVMSGNTGHGQVKIRPVN